MSAHAFPASHRLLHSTEFDAVFSHPKYRVSKQAFLVLAKQNAEGFNRLGIVIGKKNVPTAVNRNQIKRVIRETFRAGPLHQAGLDIVVLVRKQARGMAKPALRTLLTAALSGLASDVVADDRQ